VPVDDFRTLIELFEKNIVRTWDEKADDWTSRNKLARLAAESCAADLFAAAFKWREVSQLSSSETPVGQNLEHNQGGT
jgi:hypothetical protein